MPLVFNKQIISLFIAIFIFSHILAGLRLFNRKYSLSFALHNANFVFDVNKDVLDVAFSRKKTRGGRKVMDSATKSGISKLAIKRFKVLK